MKKRDHTPRDAGEMQKDHAVDSSPDREEFAAEEPVPEAPTAEEMAALEEEVRSLTHSLAVARADFHNYRKRVERDRERERRIAGEEKVLEFLPVLDNLDRALVVPADADGRSILEGVEMVRRQFHAVLEGLGVEQVPTVGSFFSPELHEAVAAVPTNDPEQNGMVMDELLAGYRTAERVLRPARVRVASYSGN